MSIKKFYEFESERSFKSLKDEINLLNQKITKEAQKERNNIDHILILYSYDKRISNLEWVIYIKKLKKEMEKRNGKNELI